MRPLRNFKPDRCYHLISRIAHRAFFLTEDERTRFVDRLWRVAGFSGVEVLACCFMSNHFHLLVYVPEAPELTNDELLERIGMRLHEGAEAEFDHVLQLPARQKEFAHHCYSTTGV